MPLSQLIRQEAAALVTELNKLYGATAIPQLPEVAEAVDAFLPLYIAERIRSNCNVFVARCKEISSAGGWFRSKGVEFKILTGVRVASYEELDIAFVRRDYPRDMTIVASGEAVVAEPGRYRKILVECSSGLSVSGDDVAHLAATLVEVTYRWIQETIERLVKADESELVRALYAIFRPACVNERLRDTLVFAAVTKAHTVYLVDLEYAAHAMAAAARESAAMMESPARVLAEILNSDIPYDLSMSKNAVDANRVRVADLRHAKYKKATGAFLPVAEAIVLGSTAVAVYPIVREGEELLVAVAPGWARDEMQRTLPTLAPRLASRFTESRGAVGHILSRIKVRLPAEAAGQVAFLLGRFVGGITHPH